MPTEILSSFPSPAHQLQAERERIAARALVRTNKARKRQGLEPLGPYGVEKDEDVRVCEHSGTKRWLLAYLAAILTIIALAGLQLLDAMQ